DLCARLALLRQQHGAQVTIFLVGSTDHGLAVAARGAGLHVVEVRRPEDLGQRIRFEVGVKVS
ncbi:MAG: hypothetical protein QME94_18525, partial [Anaerolineae bacterium]|nr:hypothetical protein [Anaerolineae bacterium]